MHSDGSFPISIDAADDTIEALLAEQGPDRPWVLWTLLGVIGCALAAMPFIQLDLGVRARAVAHVPAELQSAGDETDDIGTAGVEVDAFVSEHDYEFLKVGQRATIQYDAFPYSDWGMATGTVVGIVNRPVMIGSRAMFKVTLQSGDRSLRLPDGRSGVVVSGMGADVRFIVNRKSLMNLVFQKAERLLEG